MSSPGKSQAAVAFGVSGQFQDAFYVRVFDAAEVAFHLGDGAAQ